MNYKEFHDGLLSTITAEGISEADALDCLKKVLVHADPDAPDYSEDMLSAVAAKCIAIIKERDTVAAEPADTPSPVSGDDPFGDGAASADEEDSTSDGTAPTEDAVSPGAVASTDTVTFDTSVTSDKSAGEEGADPFASALDADTVTFTAAGEGASAAVAEDGADTAVAGEGGAAVAPPPERTSPPVGTAPRPGTPPVQRRTVSGGTVAARGSTVQKPTARPAASVSDGVSQDSTETAVSHDRKKSSTRLSPKGRAVFIAVSVVASPVLGIYFLLFFLPFIILYVLEAVLISVLIASVAAVAAAGTAASLTGIVYGIIRMFSVASEGLYEIGFGVIVAGVTMILGILLFNAAVRFMPWLFKKTAVLTRFLFTRSVDLFNKFYKRRFEKL